ncbi:MAG: DUF6624 domain-containing protein [Pseudomonadota bacterium]
MIALLFAAAILAQTQPLSPEIQARIAPVTQAIEAEVARQNALPAPANDRETLERMGQLDQVGRRVAVTVDLSDLAGAEREAAQNALWAPVEAMDHRLADQLLTMVPAEGWFYQSVYGEPAARAAFLIVQHADADLQRRFLPVLETLVATGEVEGSSYALMYDRLALDEGRPQRYGTQMKCRGGRWVIDSDNLEDPENVEARRESIGFLGLTLAQYEAGFARYPPCVEK